MKKCIPIILVLLIVSPLISKKRNCTSCRWCTKPSKSIARRNLRQAKTKKKNTEQNEPVTDNEKNKKPARPQLRNCKGCRWCTKPAKPISRRNLKRVKLAEVEENQKKEQEIEYDDDDDERPPEDKETKKLSHELIDRIKRGDVKNIEALEDLIEKGASVHYKDKEKRTALHWAAVYALPEVVELLMIEDPDMGARDYRGNTPLQLAAMYTTFPSRRETIIRAFLYAGSSVYERNDRGLNVLEIAPSGKLRNFILLTLLKIAFILH